MVIISKKCGAEGEPEGPPELEISGLLANFTLEKKPDELGDANFPPTLHAAAQLFAMAGMAEQAHRLVRTTTAFIELFKAGPDGVSQHRVGRGAACFACGHCGIAANPKESNTPTEKGYHAEVMPVCRACGDADQCNFFEIVQPDGTKVPWIEQVETTEEGEKHKAKLMGVAAGAEKKAEAPASAAPPANDLD